jgi:hypothetical protein
MMAIEMQLRGNRAPVKIRNPWAVALLPIITLGVYSVVWWYMINRELRDFGRMKRYDLGQNPTSSALALFPGGFIIVPALVSFWRGTKRVQAAARISDRQPPNGWIALLLYVVLSIGFCAYLQVSLNDIWREQAEPLPGEPLPLEPATELPPRTDESGQRLPGAEEQRPTP